MLKALFENTSPPTPTRTETPPILPDYTFSLLSMNIRDLEKGLVASWLRSTVMYLIHVLSYINFNFFKPFFNLPIQKLYNKLRSIYFVMQDLPICVNKSATMKCYSWILFFSRITLKYKNYCILTIPICLKKNFQVLKS